MSLRGGAEAIPCLYGEIATLPLVARNDNVIAFNAFVLFTGHFPIADHLHCIFGSSGGLETLEKMPTESCPAGKS